MQLMVEGQASSSFSANTETSNESGSGSGNGNGNDVELAVLTHAIQKALVVPQRDGFANAATFLTALGMGMGVGGRGGVSTDMHAVPDQSQAAP